MNSTANDDYHYARDHDASSGWVVRGPNGFEMIVPDKFIALALGKFLSGKTKEAARLIAEWKAMSK